MRRLSLSEAIAWTEAPPPSLRDDCVEGVFAVLGERPVRSLTEIWKRRVLLGWLGRAALGDYNRAQREMIVNRVIRTCIEETEVREETALTRRLEQQHLHPLPGETE